MAKHAIHCRSILCKGHFAHSCYVEEKKTHITFICVCVCVCMKPYDGQFKWSNRMKIDDFVYGSSLKRNETLYESDGQSIACTLWIHTHTHAYICRMQPEWAARKWQKKKKHHTEIKTKTKMKTERLMDISGINEYNRQKLAQLKRAIQTCYRINKPHYAGTSWNEWSERKKGEREREKANASERN